MERMHPDDLHQISIDILSGTERRMSEMKISYSKIIDAFEKSLNTIAERVSAQHDRLLANEQTVKDTLREVSESRQRIISDIDRLESMINQYQLAAVNAQTAANDAKKIVSESMGMCREDEAGRVVQVIEEKLPEVLPAAMEKAGISKPRVSGGQIAAQIGIDFAFICAATVFIFFFLNDVKAHMVRVEQKVDSHIATASQQTGGIK